MRDKVEEKSIIGSLYGKRDEFYKNNRELIASCATDEEAMIISACTLSGKKDKSFIKLLFPNITERKLDNIALRGLFSCDAELSSTYPLFGRNVEKDWCLNTAEIIKTIISLVEIKELYLSERRLSSYFSSDAYSSIFPSIEREKLDEITKTVISALYALEVLKKRGHHISLDKKKAYELSCLDNTRLLSYILFPVLDNWIRKKSFEFLHLVKKINGVREDEIDTYIARASLISSFNLFEKEDLIRLNLIVIKDGMAFSPCEETLTNEATIASDYSITLSGTFPAFLSLMAEPKRIDRIKEFQITRESVLNALSLSFKADEQVNFLRFLSNEALPVMLEERIAHWQKDYERISIERVLILRADERSANMIKNMPKVKEYILDELSPGIFIMDGLAESEWREILKSSSLFDMLSQTKGPEFNYENFEKSSPFIESDTLLELNDERLIKYDPSIKESLLSEIKEDKFIENVLKIMMVKSGIIIKKEMLNVKLDLEIADAFNYMDKERICFNALKNNKRLALICENAKGKTMAGRIEMVESFSEGGHIILSHKMLSLSRLYRVCAVESALL